MVVTIACDREHAVRKALREHGPLTSRQLAARGGSWRTVMDLLAHGEIEIAGPNDRAQLVYRLPRERGPRRPTVAEVRELYPRYAANGRWLMPLLRIATPS